MTLVAMSDTQSEKGRCGRERGDDNEAGNVHFHVCHYYVRLRQLTRKETLHKSGSEERRWVRGDKKKRERKEVVQGG